MESTENKLMGALSYLGILVLIPILIGQKTPFVRSHANQGLVLCIIEIVCRIAAILVGWIPLVGGLVKILISIISLAVLVLAIMGIVFAVQGKTKELPFIGGIKILD